jgi:hypothetical protein
MNTPEQDPELLRLEAALRAIDPGRKAAAALSERRRERVLWSWRHPILAWCLRHHALVASLLATAALVALILWMRAVDRRNQERGRIPDPVSAPVSIGAAPIPAETP